MQSRLQDLPVRSFNHLQRRPVPSQLRQHSLAPGGNMLHEYDGNAQPDAQMLQ